MNTLKLSCLSLAAMILLSACASAAAHADTSAPASSSPVSTAAPGASYDYPAAAQDDSYESAVPLVLSDTMTSAEKGVSFADGVLTITQPGTYLLSGTLNGSIVVETDKSETVRLVLDGATVDAADTAALYAKHGTLILTLAAGSENSLTGQASAETDGPEAAVYSKDDLYLNGSGSLTVTAASGDGIVSKDDLVICAGTLSVTAEDDALRGRDAVAVSGGTLTLTAGGDGIKANNDTDADKGAVYLDGGSLTVTAAHDGVQAETDLFVTDGTLNLVTGGGSANAAAHTGAFLFGGDKGGKTPPDATAGATQALPEGEAPDATAGATQALPEGEAPDATAGAKENRPSRGTPPQTADGQMPTRPSEGGTRPDATASATQATDSGAAAVAATLSVTGATANAGAGTNTDASAAAQTDTETESDSAKGLKAGGSLTLSGGLITADCADDAVHANTDVTILGGTLTLASGDDGVHADSALTISGGSLTVTSSYEGLEGTDIVISGGEQFITASDDGVNAAGGNDGTTGNTGFDRFSAASGTLTVTGGTLWVNADGDGLDANGVMELTGGLLLVNGPTNNGNGALDYDGSCTAQGAVLIAVGASGMAQAPSGGQPSLMVTFSTAQVAGTTLQLCDEGGTVLYSFTAQKSFNNIVISSPALQEGKTYTLCAADEGSTEATGYAEGGTKGTEIVSATLSGSVTSISDTGAAVSAGMGAPGGMGGKRPRG